MEGFDLVDTGTHRRGENGEMEQLPENWGQEMANQLWGGAEDAAATWGQRNDPQTRMVLLLLLGCDYSESRKCKDEALRALFLTLWVNDHRESISFLLRIFA